MSNEKATSDLWPDWTESHAQNWGQRKQPFSQRGWKIWLVGASGGNAQANRGPFWRERAVGDSQILLTSGNCRGETGFKGLRASNKDSAGYLPDPRDCAIILQSQPRDWRKLP